MASFNEQIARMQSLMNYGMLSESETKPSKSIEYHQIAADGNAYGIIKENNHYVIKKAPAEKENILESYEYIDGWNHLDKHEYKSYNEAKKQFGFKMSSLNEAYNFDVNKDNVSAYVDTELMTEGTEKMMNDIARQKQIMYNAAAILKEESSISQKNIGTPEAPKTASCDPATSGKPFETKTEATLDKDPKAATGKPESKGEPYGDGEKPEKMKDAEYVPDGSVANQKPKGGKVVKVNEAEDKTFAKGLPDSAGVGSPSETKKHIMEDDELDDEDVVDAEDIEGEGQDMEEPEITDGDIDLGTEEDGIESTEDELGDDLSDDELDLGSEDEGEDDIESLKSQIEKLEARIEELEAGEDIEGDEDEDIEPEDEDFGEEGEDIETEDLPADDEELGDDDEDLDADDADENFMESVIRSVSGKIINENRKAKYMNNIVESVVNNIISEERTELHDFGKHPGYRKKPMTLPETGSDEFDGRRDWNDDSVHNEQPFGQGKGKSDPYGMEKKIQKTVNDIMEEIKKKVGLK